MTLCRFFCLRQKTAYEMRISDWSSDVCSSDLPSVRIPWQGLSWPSLGLEGPARRAPTTRRGPMRRGTAQHDGVKTGSHQLHPSDLSLGMVAGTADRKSVV